MEVCPQAAAFLPEEEEDVGVCEVEACFMEAAQHVQSPEAGRSNPAMLYNRDGLLIYPASTSKGCSSSLPPRKVNRAFADADNSLLMTRLHLRENEFRASKN